MVNHFLSAYRLMTLSLCALALLFVMTIPSPSMAQSTKPQLVEIILNEETSDPKAVEVVEKIYSDWIKKEKRKYGVGLVQARFLPLAKKGSNDKFILGVLYDEPLGGCFARGCRTVIFHSKRNNEWVGVFNAFIHSAWYDNASRDTAHANLIFSSMPGNKDPGVWLWNGTGYELVNKK